MVMISFNNLLFLLLNFMDHLHSLMNNFAHLSEEHFHSHNILLLPVFPTSLLAT